MPIFKAQVLSNLSWIKWTFKHYSDVRVIALHHPHVIKFRRLKITNFSKAESSSSRSPPQLFQRFVYISSQVLNNAGAILQKKKEDEKILWCKAFVGFNTTNVKHHSTGKTSLKNVRFLNLTFLFSLDHLPLTMRS